MVDAEEEASGPGEWDRDLRRDASAEKRVGATVVGS